MRTEIFQNCINEATVIDVETPNDSAETITEQVEARTKHSKTKLILDVKTRWNSLADMLETFIELLPAVRRALLKIGSDLEFTAANAKAIKDILSAIKPFRDAVVHLSANKANQIDVMGVINYLRKELANSNTVLAKNLLSSLNERIKNRCNDTLIQLSLFLQNPKSLNLDDNEKNSLFEYIDSLFKRLWPNYKQEHCSVKEKNFTTSATSSIEAEKKNLT